jgi:protein tyrosine phosphatase
MEEPNGYINASWIDMHGGNFHRQWIAAQGPTQKTIGSFWRCVWETETSLILMLTRLFENANSKCDK